MTMVVPPHVQSRADAADLGPLMAVLPHPNRRVYALTYGGWFVMMAGLVVAGVAGLVLDPGPNWPVSVLILVPVTAVTYWLYLGTVGSLRRRAFYLYSGGYLITTSLGRVARAERWADVTSISGFVPVGYGPRILDQINHRRGRPVKFTELPGRETVGPMLQQAHTEAVQAG